MAELRKAALLAAHNFQKWPVNPRVYVVFLLELAYVHWMCPRWGTSAPRGATPWGLGCSPSSWRSPTPG